MLILASSLPVAKISLASSRVNVTNIHAPAECSHHRDAMIAGRGFRRSFPLCRGDHKYTRRLVLNAAESDVPLSDVIWVF